MREQFAHFVKVAQKIIPASSEPLMNVFCTYENGIWSLVIFLRQKHRPDAYFAAGEKMVFVSPGAVDMAGVIITPRLIDFNRLECAAIRGIYQEVSLPEKTMNIIVNEL